MNKNVLPLCAFMLFILFSPRLSAQTFQGCDTNAIKAAFAAAGHYTQLIVDNEPCSLYFIDNNSTDAATAQAAAQTLGANTSVMNNAAENTNVNNALNAGGYLCCGQIIWLGYHRTGATDGSPFITLDGSPFTYSNWAPGEPNNSGYGGGANSPGCYIFGSCLCTGQAAYNCSNGEECVQMYSSGTWNDLACNSNSTAVVEVNLCPQITTNNDTLLCAAGATLNLTSSTILGSPPYTYNWSPGGQNTSGITVNPATTTTYSITATDRYSCFASKSILANVVNVAAPVVTATPASVCVNQTTSVDYTGTYSGTAVLNWGFSGATVVGSSSPYTLSWPTAGPENVTLYVTDQGCTGPTGTATVTVNSYPVANAGPAVAVCSGAAVTLGVAPVGGVTYSWSPALGLSSAAVSNPTFSAVNPGTTTLSYPYTLTASENNCSTTASATVTLYPPIDNSFTVSPTTLCTGQNATITYTGTNDNTATYTWAFGGGTVVSGTGQGPYVVNWISAGSPAVTLNVNQNNCAALPNSVTLTVNSIPTANAGADVQFCSGASASLGGPTVNGVSYSWTPTIGLSNPSSSSPSITAVNPGGASIVQNYIITATENGCSASDTAVVTLFPAVVTTFNINPTALCIGGNTTITYSGVDSSSANFVWNFSGATVISGTGSGPYVVNWATAGSPAVTLNITDDGCTGTLTSQTVTVSNPPVANAGGNQTVCSGGTIQLGVAPVAGINYSWSPATNLTGANTAQPSFTYSNTGATAQTFTYNLTADQSGCTAGDQAVITVSPPATIAIVASGPLEFCDGGSVGLSLALPYSTYLWSTGSAAATVTVSTAGLVGVSVADASGCEFIGTPVTVIVDPNPTVSLVQQTNEQCYGQKDGSLTVSAGSGTPAYTYGWSTTPAQSTAAISSLAPGPYTVTVTDVKNCTVTGQYTITAAPFFGLITDSLHNVSCFGLSDGAIFISVHGGTPDYSYSWSNGKSSLQNNDLVAGNYTLSTTDANGCPATDSAIITQPVQIVLTASDSLVMDFNSHITLPLTVSPAGDYTYLWSPDNSLSCNNCPTPTSFAPENTTYQVIVTDTDGCTVSLTVPLIVNAGKHLFVPNVFTPNGDNSNDVFRVYTYGETFFHLAVFDRWGEKMFETNSLDLGWDGMFKGKYAQAGNYVYTLTITYLDGQTMHKDGTVTLLR